MNWNLISNLDPFILWTANTKHTQSGDSGFVLNRYAYSFKTVLVGNYRNIWRFRPFAYSLEVDEINGYY